LWRCCIEFKFEEKNIKGLEDIYGEDGREEKSADSCMCMIEKEIDSIINKLETYGQVLGLHQSSREYRMLHVQVVTYT
jgi:hypothetical protein